MFYNQLFQRNQELEQEIQSLQQQLKTYPQEHLICTKNGKFVKWYKSNSHTLTYIPKNNRQIAENLAVKKYLMSLLDDCLYEKKAIQAYLRNYNPTNKKAVELLSDSSCYKELLNSHFQSYSDELTQWKNSSYEKSTKYPEQLLLKTISGNTVRSKSESMIDMALYTHHIPFRYECALILDDITFFPDFTILHPTTGQIFYWEHFGMMDNSSYCKSTYSKLELYSNYNLIPSINLITTFETKANPLNFDILEKIIQHYFLTS